MDNVYTFVAIIKSSEYVVSYCCFLSNALLFRGEVVNFLHVPLSFNSSIYFTFISFDSNFNYMKAQISVFVPLHTLSALLICFRFEMKNYPQLCFCVIMALYVLSTSGVNMLFVNLAVLLKLCITRINTCFCELIRCAGGNHLVFINRFLQ
jgi:hypothetical protein